MAAAAQVDPVLNDIIGIDVLRHQQSNQEVTAPIPIPWKKSSAKEDLVKELLNPTSGIRNMSIDEIYQSNAKYKCYKYDNFYNNVTRLLKKHGTTLPSGKKKGNKQDTNKIGSKNTKTSNTKNKKKGPEWRGSKSKRFLSKLLLDKTSWIHKKTDDEVYRCQECFMEYDRSVFQKHLNNERKLAEKTSTLVAQQEREFALEQMNNPRKPMTIRGYPFWDSHPANLLLKEDVETGLVSRVKPAELRALRKEYKEFPLKVFRSHIYQEQRERREKDYWVVKRNKNAQRIRDREVKKMKEQWEKDQLDEGMGDVCRQWEHWNLR